MKEIKNITSKTYKDENYTIYIKWYEKEKLGESWLGYKNYGTLEYMFGSYEKNINEYEKLVEKNLDLYESIFPEECWE